MQNLKPNMHPTPSEFIAAEYDPQLERAFFRRIVLSNGCFKSTDTGRLHDVNDAVLETLRSLPARPIRILDLAASSGVSTQEWYTQLAAQGVDAVVTGTDISLDALYFRTGTAEFLLDKQLTIIHLSLFGSGCHPRVLKVLRTAGLNAVVRCGVKLGVKLENFRLVSKAVTDVSILEEDLDTPPNGSSGRFDVVRAANVLNLVYFPPSRIRRLLSNALGRLKPGGVLIVCRTHHDGTNHATIFRFSGGRLSVITRVGMGSEIEQLALELS